MYDKKKSKKSKGKVSTAAIRSAVKGYIDKQVETKKKDKAEVPSPCGINAPLCLDISPTITQGSGEGERLGLKMLITGSRFEMNVQTQVSATNAIKYKYYIINNPDAITLLTPAQVLSLFLDANTFVPGQRDYHSLRNPDNLQSLKIVAQGRGVLNADTLALTQTAYSQISRNLKLNLLQKYASDGISSTLMNRLYLLIVTDSGDTTFSSGLTITSAMRYFFKDA